MSLIMIFYYLLSLYLVIILAWNFLREKKSVNDMILILLVLIPLVLRILRIK
jgi:uncharacterized membrane protein